MARAHRLATRELAAWWRARHVPVLYPIDLSGEGAYDVPVPADTPELELLRRVAAAPRVSVFVMHVSPDRVLRSTVALAGGDDAVLVDVTGKQADVRAIGSSEGVRAVGELLPDLAPLLVPDLSLPESDWSAIVALLASGLDAQAQRERLHARGLPRPLAEAMITAAAAPATVGTAGVQVFVDGAAQLGPSLLSWQELPAGALLTHLHAPRRPGPLQVELGAYRRETVLRGLTDAVSTALYRVRG